MYLNGRIQSVKEDQTGTYFTLFVPDLRLKEYLKEKQVHCAEMRLDDGRSISEDQRKKAYATLRDIAIYTGYFPEECKEWMKYYFISRTGSAYFSLSDCSVETARDFISCILEYALENGIPLSDHALNRTDDINRYLYHCIKHKKCCICGKDGEIHHVDTIGMGNDRRKVEDSGYKKICLCRMHHTIAHQRGKESFEKMYHVYGITAP